MECLRYPGAEFGSVEEEPPPPFGMSEYVRGIPSAAMECSDRRVTLSGQCNFGSPGGRSEPRLGNPTKELEEELRVPALESSGKSSSQLPGF